MKKLYFISGIIVISAMFLISCGGGNKSEIRKMDSKLDTLITNMAACEQQNTNCEACNKANEGIQAMAKDTNMKFLVDDLFNGIAQSASGPRRAACAHAINFWVGNSDYYENKFYGKIVLDALKKEIYDQKSYTGSTLGQLLAGWLVTEDEALLSEIHAAISDKNTEKRGRMELIRLSGEKSFAKKGYLDLLIKLAKDTTEAEELRKQTLGVLWRVKDASHIQKVEDLYIGFLTNSSAALVGAALEGLGYMKSVKGFGKVLETVEKFGADENYYFATARSLSNYISGETKEGIDNNKAFALAVKMANNTKLKASYRCSYIYAIENFGGIKAQDALAKLSASPEKDIADPAKQGLQRLKSKD